MARPHALWSYTIAGWSGFYVMVVELLSGRLIAPSFGNSIYVWGSVIFVFMLALAIGYLLGGIYSQYRPSVVRLCGLLVAGRLHRRAKQKRVAHDLLGRAAEVFDANPAPVWADRARDERRRVGLRPSAPDGLTPTEARVAALAAAGRTNREIAAEVFASPKTVEAVLGRVYRKLGVRSRVELVAALPPPGP